MFVSKGQVIRLLELAKNFRLADHHGIQSARHLEEMVQAHGLRQLIQFIPQFTGEGVVGDEKFLQLRKRRFRRQGRGYVNLHAVTGGENCRLRGHPRIPQRLQRRGNLLPGKGESLAQFHWRGAVTQSNDYKAHLKGFLTTDGH